MNAGKTVTSFYGLMFNQCTRPRAIQRHTGDVYIQYELEAADGAAAFLECFERMTRDYPGKRIRFKRVISEGDYLVLHRHQEWPGEQNRAGADILSPDDNGNLVEHWNVLQGITERSATKNTAS